MHAQRQDLKIFDAKPHAATSPKGIAGKLGEIVAVEADGITVVCADGRFKVTRVQADGPKVGAGEWAKAANIATGASFTDDVWSSPRKRGPVNTASAFTGCPPSGHDSERTTHS